MSLVCGAFTADSPSDCSCHKHILARRLPSGSTPTPACAAGAATIDFEPVCKDQDQSINLVEMTPDTINAVVAAPLDIDFGQYALDGEEDISLFDLFRNDDIPAYEGKTITTTGLFHDGNTASCDSNPLATVADMAPYFDRSSVADDPFALYTHEYESDLATAPSNHEISRSIINIMDVGAEMDHRKLADSTHTYDQLSMQLQTHRSSDNQQQIPLTPSLTLDGSHTSVHSPISEYLTTNYPEELLLAGSNGYCMQNGSVAELFTGLTVKHHDHNLHAANNVGSKQLYPPLPPFPEYDGLAGDFAIWNSTYGAASDLHTASANNRYTSTTVATGLDHGLDMPVSIRGGYTAAGPIKLESGDQSLEHPAQFGRGVHRDKTMDQFIVDNRAAGMSYSKIKALGGFKEAESTLRGRYRTLTKPKEARVRKPEWTDNDMTVLKQTVNKYISTSNGHTLVHSNHSHRHGSKAQQHALERVPWKQVADTMANRGCYRFGNATVKKKYMEIMGLGNGK